MQHFDPHARSIPMGRVSVSRSTFDWSRAIRVGEALAVENTRSDVKLDATHVMWELLREAASVSARAYPAPPRSSYPAKSSMPDAPGEFSEWQRMAAYLRGEVQEASDFQPTPPRPSAEQVTRAEAVLDVWHRHALRRKGDAPRIKKAVYLKACGVKDARVRAVTGLTKQALHAAKVEAMRDMWSVVRPHTSC